MRIWIKRKDSKRYEGFPQDPDPSEVHLIEEILNAPEIMETHSGPRPRDSLSEVLRLLIYRWLTEKGPITLKEIGHTLGYTFQPVRTALDQLSRYVRHEGKSGVELSAFPREPWARLVHNAGSVRDTVHFTSRTQNARSSESLLRRLQNLQLTTEVAVGGVEGARRYFPALDLLGLPRLDLCVHGGTPQSNLEFVRLLDPALERSKDQETRGALAVHFLYRKASLFQEGWADPVECLLDLHELRLEAQALAFLRSFPPARQESL